MKSLTRSVSSGVVSFVLGFGFCGVLAAGIAAGPLALPTAPPTNQVSNEPADEQTPFQTLNITPSGIEHPATSKPGDSTTHGSIPWEQLPIVALPVDVLAAAKETVDELDIREAYVAKLGTLTLFTVGGIASGHEVALVLTEQGTVLQADASTSSDAIPDEVASVVKDRFPGASISKAGISQVVSFWAKLTTPEGRNYTVTFEPQEGLEVVDADPCGTEADFFTDPFGVPSTQPRTDADPDASPHSGQ